MALLGNNLWISNFTQQCERAILCRISLKDFPLKHQKKIYYRIKLFKELGLQKSLQVRDVKKIKGEKYKNLYELIIDYGKMFYRIFFTMIKGDCWFVHSIGKKSNKIPVQALKKATNIKKQLEEQYGL